MASKVVERPFGPFERMLAVRYLGAKREHGGLAFISIVSVIGITLGVWALILTMSIMNGFRLELISKILGFEPHVYIVTQGLPKQQIDAALEDVARIKGVEAVEPMIERMALAEAHGQQEGAQVRGIRPQDLRNNKLISDSIRKLNADGMLAGSLEDFGKAPEGEDEGLSNTIVVGRGLAEQMGLYVGDTVTLIQGAGRSTPVGRVPRSRAFKVVALFHVGNERYDRYSMFLPLAAAENFYGYDDGYPLIGVRVKDPDLAADYKRTLASDLNLYSQTWIERSGNYFQALQVERNVMRLILFIVVVITALNIITGILMLVKNKARDIAILRTIGATRSGVVRVFLMSGAFLGMAGVLTGLATGLLCVIYIAPIQHFLEGLVGVELFPHDVYMLDHLPAKLEWAEVGSVTGAAFIVTIVMSIIPAMWAARLDPVEALRFQ